jgi:hypothetical protein
MNKIIVNLEGKEYQIDIQKAKELGVIKEKDTRCKSWEEFKLKCRGSKGYYMDSVTGEIYNPVSPLGTSEQLTQQEAIAIQAFSKLLKLRRDWVGYWEPNWCEVEPKYCVITVCNYLKIAKFCTDHHAFAFPTQEMAKEFLECFKDLFEQCKNII